MSQGAYVPGGALNVTLNDATTKGAYMPDGSLRVTDVVGTGIQDASGALRIKSVAGLGVYAAQADSIRYSDAATDGKTGVQFPDGAIRMQTQGTTPVTAYVTEAGDPYVTENGSSFYVTE